MKISENATKHVLKGTLILTVAGLLIKVLSSFYRVPYQNIVGDTGFYIYQQVYPIYGIIMVIAVYGIPAAVSKMIADSDGTTDEKRRILSATIFWVGAAGVTGFLFLFYGSEEIAILMSDENLALLIKVVALTCLIVPITSILRGYFQGNNDMMPTAVSATVEQTVRVITILTALFVLTASGANLYVVGAGAMMGAVTGGIASVITLFYFAKKSKTNYDLPRPDLEALKRVGKVLLFQGLAFCLVNMILVLLQLMDSFQLYKTLVESGIPEEVAKSMKGVYDRGQPLIQMGTILATSLALAVVPVLAKLIKNKAFRAANEKVIVAIRLAVGLSLGAAIGLVLIMEPLNIMLFSDSSGTQTLRILSTTVFFASITISSSTILQLYGRSRLIFIVVSLTVAIKCVMNSLLIAEHGVNGAAVASVVALMFSAGVTLFSVRRQIGQKIFKQRDFIMLGVSALVMALVVHIGVSRFEWESISRIHAGIGAVSLAGIGAGTYVLLLFKMKFFGKEELSILPKNEKLRFLLPKNER